MPLFFLLAGVGIRHSLRSRTRLEFVRERAWRLLVPLVAGAVLLVPPQVHAERAAAGIEGSYTDTLREFSEVSFDLDFPVPLEGSGSLGEFELAHLWFLGDLFAFSVLLLPLLWRLRGGWRRIGPATVLAAGVPVALLEAALASEDTGGWHGTVYVVMLLYGFLLAAEPSARAAVARVARPAAWCAFAGFAVLAGAGLAFEPEELLTGYAPVDVAWRALKGVVGWLFVLSAVALIGRLRLPAVRPAVLRYAREAALPVYVLHQTVVVVLAWRILEWDVPAPLQLAALIVGSLAGTLALHECLRRIPGAGVLLGQRKRSSSRARTSAAAPAPSSAVT